eukprot:359021-Chlamydomonas_euryale.AAC.1
MDHMLSLMKELMTYSLRGYSCSQPMAVNMLVRMCGCLEVWGTGGRVGWPHAGADDILAARLLVQPAYGCGHAGEEVWTCGGMGNAGAAGKASCRTPLVLLFNMCSFCDARCILTSVV